ncbi:MAG: diguanylate cyclase, partial [Gemmatimonadota bacterium]|nr:diguanylate cyclase [Gemmatimonadota bacterium]
DEFAALLVEADEERGERVRQRLCDTVEGLRLLAEDGGHIGLSVSIGAAHFPETATEAHALLREADIALYRAKREPRRPPAG